MPNVTITSIFSTSSDTLLFFVIAFCVQFFIKILLNDNSTPCQFFTVMKKALLLILTGVHILLSEFEITSKKINFSLYPAQIVKKDSLRQYDFPSVTTQENYQLKLLPFYILCN